MGPLELRDKQMELSTYSIEESLCEALNGVSAYEKNPARFLELVCKHCKVPYDQDEELHPVIEALQRARRKDPTSSNWWSELLSEHDALSKMSHIRVKMCEYLCLVAHEEVVNIWKGVMKPEMSLARATLVRDQLLQAFDSLQNPGWRFKVSQ